MGEYSARQQLNLAKVEGDVAKNQEVSAKLQELLETKNKELLLEKASTLATLSAWVASRSGPSERKPGAGMGKRVRGAGMGPSMVSSIVNFSI